MNKLRTYNLQHFGIKRWRLEDEYILTMPRYNLCVIAPQKNDGALKQLKTLLKAKSELCYFSSKNEFLAYAKDAIKEDSDAKFCLVQVLSTQTNLEEQLFNADTEGVPVVLYLFSTSWGFLNDADARDEMMSEVRALSRGFIDYTPKPLYASAYESDKLYLTVYLLGDYPLSDEIISSLELDFGEMDMVVNLEKISHPDQINIDNLDGSDFIAIINYAKRPLPLDPYKLKLVFYVHVNNDISLYSQNPESCFKWINEVIHSFTGVTQDPLPVYFDPPLRELYQNDIAQRFPINEWHLGLTAIPTTGHYATPAQDQASPVSFELPPFLTTTNGFMLVLAFVGSTENLLPELVTEIANFFGVQAIHFATLEELQVQLEQNQQVRVGIITNQQLTTDFLGSGNYSFCISLDDFSQLQTDSNVFTACTLIKSLITTEYFRQHLNFRKPVVQ